MITRRAALIGAGAGAALASAPRITLAADYPSQPITIVIPFVPGGTSDIIARVLAQKLQPILGVNLVVENRAGAGGTVGVQDVAKADPDGYTILAGAIGNLAFTPWLYPQAKLDPVKSFAPITQDSVVPNVLVINPKLPVNNVKELVAYIKANPGKVNYASAGVGSAAHISVAYFSSVAGGLDMVHIPYKGTGPALTDIVAGRCQMTITGAPPVMPFAKSGQLKALAITSLERAPFLPDLPTVAESGYPGFEAVQWNGLLAPAKTPPAIVQKLHDAVAKVMSDPETVSKFRDEGALVVNKSSADFAKLIATDYVKWGDVIKKAGITGG